MKVPAWHGVHAVDPATDEYLLGGHKTHPASTIAPVITENLPAAQSVHAFMPRINANVPGAHCSQDPLPGPYLPAGHSNRYSHKVLASSSLALTPSHMRR